MNISLHSYSHWGRLQLKSRASTVRVNFTRGPVREPDLPTQPREVLREMASIGDDTFTRVNFLHCGMLEQLDSTRLLPVLSRLMGPCHLSSRDLQLILIRYPQAFAMRPEVVEEVLQFLTTDLQLDSEQLRSVITRFPQVFSYSVKAHLAPQLAYLQSLGVEQDQLKEFICARPLLLGEGIETVIKFLRICGVPRRQMASLLRSYPIDYCCKFIFPGQSGAGESLYDN